MWATAFIREIILQFCTYYFYWYVRCYTAAMDELFLDLTQIGRICTKCEVYKTLEYFWSRPTGRLGIRGACIECLKDSWTKVKHKPRWEERKRPPRKLGIWND